MSAAKTFAEALAQATGALRDSGIDAAGTDARWLLAHAADVPRDRLTMLARDPLPEAAATRLDALVSRRVAREPVSIIIGSKEFYGRSFTVDSDVLSPRPETETLVGLALSEPFGSVLDLGTGTGCILLTLVLEAQSQIHLAMGTDLSEAALTIAARNRDALGADQTVQLQKANWYEGLCDGLGAGFRGFDLIVSNPPYIAANEMDCLVPEVKDHEPHIALTDGADGLTAYRTIAAGASGNLAPGGRLLVEIGPSQGRAVAALFRDAGLEDVAIHPDLDGRDRVVSARAPNA